MERPGTTPGCRLFSHMIPGLWRPRAKRKAGELVLTPPSLDCGASRVIGLLAEDYWELLER